MIEETRNFDWGETRRKLCIFMPCFNDPSLIEASILLIKTVVDPKDYIIILGNDNVNFNWDHLRDHHVRFFTLRREGVPEGTPRNGAFIRNYALSRMQSELYMMKDAEVMVFGDFIYDILHFGTGWRPGTVYSLSKEQTKSLREQDPHDYPKFLSSQVPQKVVGHPIFEDAYQIKQMLLDADGKVNPTTYFHYAYAAPLGVVQNIGGYDEDFTAYGWEDSDMYCRLFANKVLLCPDENCIAVHPWHARTSDSIPQAVNNMRDVFVTKSPQAYFRNTQGWGRGE